MTDKQHHRLILIGLIILFAYLGYQFGSYLHDRNQIRQLTKEKLKIEIELLKIEIEYNEIQLQKEY